MSRVRKKSVSVVVVLAMLATMLFAFAGTASAAASYTGGAPLVSAGETQNLATIKGVIDAGDLRAGNVLTVRLPAGFELPADVRVTSGAQPLLGNFVEFWVPQTVGQEDNALWALANAGNITARRVSDREMSFRLEATPVPTQRAFFYLYLRSIFVPAGFSGEIKATLSSNGGFGSAEVVVGKVGRGEVTVAVDNAPAFTERTEDITLRFTENMAGALVEHARSVSLRLPNGFEWADASFGAVIWGDENIGVDPIIRDNDPRILDLDVFAASGQKTSFTITATIQVADPSVAKAGDVTVTVTGASKVSPSSLVVAKYGDFGVEVSAKEAPDVYAGQLGQAVGDIVISEKVPGSLVEQRSILLTLPAWAKWGRVDTNPEAEGGLEISYGGFIGSDARTVRYTVDASSAVTAGKITLEDMEVVLAADAPAGDLEITVSGSAGVSGKVVVAKVKPPVTVSAQPKDVIIGAQGQEAGSITITEAAAGILNTGENLTLTVPEGVRFVGVPSVSVKSGDLIIDARNVRLTNNFRTLTIPVVGDSSTASTIEVTGIKYTVDRTYPEGEVPVWIGGGAVNEVNDQSQVADYWAGLFEDEEVVLGGRVDIDEDGDPDFTIPADGVFPGANTVATAVNANCITPAPPVETAAAKVTASFTVGSTSYKVGDQEKTMDVAPFVENGRTYLPIRYAAYAVGVGEDNIFWDDATRTATIVKGDRVVQLVADSWIMRLNGAEIRMDAEAKIVNGRFVLPIRWVANALACQVDWDEATKTVTITQP